MAIKCFQRSIVQSPRLILQKPCIVLKQSSSLLAACFACTLLAIHTHASKVSLKEKAVVPHWRVTFDLWQPLTHRLNCLVRSRSPHRPNNIGISFCRIESIVFKAMAAHLRGIDLVNGTPVLDIKPFISI
jgi:tRNA-methyltransferase O